MDKQFDWHDYIYIDKSSFTEQGISEYTKMLDLLSKTPDGRQLIVSAFQTDNKMSHELRYEAGSDAVASAGNKIIFSGTYVGTAEAITGSGIIDEPRNGAHSGVYDDQDGNTQRFTSLESSIHELFHIAHPAASEELTVDYTDRFMASNFVFKDKPFHIRGTYDNGVDTARGKEPDPALKPAELPYIVKKALCELKLPAAALEYNSLPEAKISYGSVDYTPPVTPTGQQSDKCVKR